MPQENPYFLKLDDSTTIEVAGRRLPEGFHKLGEYQKDSIARKMLIKHIEQIRESQRPATASDFLVPIAILLIIAAVIMLIAKRVRDNPKLYDRIVRKDEE